MQQRRRRNGKCRHVAHKSPPVDWRSWSFQACYDDVPRELMVGLWSQPVMP